MTDRSKLRNSRAQGFAALVEPHVRLAGLAALAAAPVFLVAALVPRTLILPSISLVGIGAAAIAAFAAWSFGPRQHGNTVTLWDIAGASMLIGCAAGMLSEPETILLTFVNP